MTAAGDIQIKADDKFIDVMQNYLEQVGKDGGSGDQRATKVGSQELILLDPNDRYEDSDESYDSQDEDGANGGTRRRRRRRAGATGVSNEDEWEWETLPDGTRRQVPRRRFERRGINQRSGEFDLIDEQGRPYRMENGRRIYQPTGYNHRVPHSH